MNTKITVYQSQKWIKLCILSCVTAIHAFVIIGSTLLSKEQVTPPQLINVSLIGAVISAPVRASTEANASSDTPIVEPTSSPKEQITPEILQIKNDSKKAKATTIKNKTKPIIKKEKPRETITQKPPKKKAIKKQTKPVESQKSAASISKGEPLGQKGIVTEPSHNAAYLRNAPPRYPTLSRKQQEQGTVILTALISTEGTVKTLTIKISSGHQRLDKAALNAVKKWHFIPAKKGEETIEMQYDIPVTFSLEQ